MRLWAKLALVLLLLSALHRPAAAWTYGDTLTVIWKPLPNLPAFVRSGDVLTVWASASSGATGWSASLKLGTLAFPLGSTGATWNASLGWWVLSFMVPQHVPEEIYDLTLACSTCPADTARHAVKVIRQFKDDFYFAQISDTHLPSHAFSSDYGFSTSDTTGLIDFNAVIDDLNLIHPEFVLHTGDVVNEGELEEYLGMYEMGRAQGMISRLRDPLFLVAGNHDIGGWQPTPPPAGTSRKNWWRYFGWPCLANPPAGYPYHSQDYSFDYGLLHCIGMEGYLNSGSYDNYLPAIYGASSMTQEQMNWLAADVATVPQGQGKLAFFHYDFASQFTNLAALGLDGAIWGHNHEVAEGNRAAQPFNLGLQSVIPNSYGGRTFRLFRVYQGVITPGPMHHSGGTSGAPTDSLAVAWAFANNGARSRNTAAVTNRFGEGWNFARLVFYLVNHDSLYAATGGVVAQVIRQAGVTAVYVDCNVPASGTLTVSVAPTQSALDVTAGGNAALRLGPPSPNPFRPSVGSLSLSFTLPVSDQVSVRVYDLGGRQVAVLFEGPAAAGAHALTWDGRLARGGPAKPGIYLVRLATSSGEKRAKVAVRR